ncbi:DUF2975 domain-containing protein [uncultured Roseibium sp.]|uniref:DUF2975 domain-containing protein n=1 Tax=uncultured Roseibium sp. TaxID=1936171 RepID=UPI00262ECD36|nr:DUF2975 domain-containing protein [uncultured Roseibium sp.]
MSELEQVERELRLSRIRRLSTAMKWFVTVVLIMVAVVGALLVITVLLPVVLDAVTETVDLSDIERDLGDIPFVQRIGVGIVLACAFALLLGICWNTRQLFDQFRKAAFFAPETLARIIKIGIWLLAYGIFDILSDPILSVLVTWDFPNGEGKIEVALDGGEAFFLIFGALMLVFGWIMREAATIAEENRQFV